MKRLLHLAAAACLTPVAAAQLVVVTSFNPTSTGSLCGAAYGSDLFAYGCFGGTIERYATDGSLVAQFARPGFAASDVDLDIAPAAFTLGANAVPAGALLYIDGESGAAEVYAVDPMTGALIATLSTAFGDSHVVGGAYHAERGTLFLVQDKLAGLTANTVAEIDPLSGAVLNTFSTSAAGVIVNFGDLDVSQCTGNLLVVSSDESSIAEFTPTGTLLAQHPLPSGVSGLSGIGTDDTSGLFWVAGNGGTVSLLAGLDSVGTSYCGPAAPNSSTFSGEVRASGSAARADDCLSLVATNLPANQFGYFLNSLTQGSSMPGTSQGTLCLGGAIGRYNAFVAGSGAAGALTLDLDLGATPTPGGNVSIGAGETWHFTCWFRDNNPNPTSNFTDAVSVTFL